MKLTRKTKNGYMPACLSYGDVPKWLRERFAKPFCSGSIPDVTSIVRSIEKSPKYEKIARIVTTETNLEFPFFSNDFIRF